MEKRRQQILNWIIQYFSDYFHYPATFFKPNTDLRDDLYFDAKSLVDVGRDINKSKFTPAHVTPGQIIACSIIQDIVDLIDNLEKSS